MSRRRAPVLLIAIAIVVGLVCIRLAFWQLSRLGERRAVNAVVAARLDSAIVDPSQLPADTSLAHFRRVLLVGTLDYANEMVLSGRGFNGSPGVNLLTPMRLPGRDTAILVNRGWVYAPDAMTVDLARWREPSLDSIYGFVSVYPPTSVAESVVAEQPRTLRSLDGHAVAAAMPYPVAPYYVVATTPAVGDRDSVPARLPPPALDEGPHMGYAFQWSAFAFIAFVGAFALWRSGRSGKEEEWIVPPAPELPR